MRLRGLAVAALGLAVLWPAAAAHAQTTKPAATVNAEGNATQLTGPLQFNPGTVSVRVGESVEWINTDFLVPHTATEDHGLWNLGGTYAGTPANPPGFGPGETRTRRFAAGSWSYFCEVHPAQMHGRVNVPDELASRPTPRRRRHGKSKKKRVRQFQISVVWAAEPLPPGQVVDVQTRKGDGNWRTIEVGTTELQGVFPAGRAGTTWSFRTRVRSADEPGRASGFSPAATIRVG
jgi:plastocyanin